MYQQEIKSKARARQLSKVLAMDLMLATNIFGGYIADVVPSSTDLEVEFYSTDYCAIITEHVLERVWKVIDCYETEYLNINHHLDVHEIDGRCVPAIVVCVSWKKD